jgi:small GTP-binding protein
MPKLDDLTQKLPPEAQQVYQTVWETLSPAERSSLESLVLGMPSQVNIVNILLNLSSAQVKMAFGKKHRVAIVGPTNVGKSTLYNHFIQVQEDKAMVSPLPGTTRNNQTADAGLFSIIDTPGADAIGEIGEYERDQALSAANGADFLVIVFDAMQGIKRNELDIFNALAMQGKPYVVVMNKIDVVKGNAKSVIEQAASSLHLKPEQIIPISAKTGHNLNTVLMAIAITEPGIVVALGQSMPRYRWQLAWRVIASSASIAAVIGATPLPVVDFAPLLITQSIMVLGIARIYNYQITIERARELIAAFGMGLIGRLVFGELSKLVGVPGWILAAAVAASITVVMGYSSVIWFSKGEKISMETTNKLTRLLTEYLVDRLKNIIKRRPSSKKLEEIIIDSLEATSIGQDPENLTHLGQDNK